MHRVVMMICAVFLCLAASVCGAAQPSAAAPGIAADHLYSGVNRSAMITVTSPRSFGTVSLALMDHEGNPLAESVQVMPGRHDLAELIPAIFTLKRAAFLQLISGSEPVGSALVVQPMLSRMVPITETRIHQVTGKPHQRIVGWKDENEPEPATPRVTPAQSTPAEPPSNNASQPSSQQAPSVSVTLTPDPPQTSPTPRLCIGVRLYNEQDVFLHTSLGDIRLALRPDTAPNTAWNFLELCRGGFYRDVVFHRVVKLDREGRPFVIQAGDPTATGDGGPGWWLPIENSDLPHDFGVISMARSDDPDSAGSQFFIALSREGTARLDGQYCAFGYAVEGADAIVAISEVELVDVAAGRPSNPPVIKSAQLVPAPPRTPNVGRPDQRVTPDSPKPAQRGPVRVPR